MAIRLGDAASDADLRDAGYAGVLPWVLLDQRLEMLRDTIRRQVEVQTQGLPPAVVEQVLEQAYASAGVSAAGEEDDPDKTAGAMVHELGHLWFSLGLGWPEAVDGRTAYGAADAPDWMDEVAAVLMENATLTDGRRAHLSALYVDGGEDALAPLATYLSLEHPLLAAAAMRQEVLAQRAAEGGANQSQAIVLTGEDAQAFLAQSTGMAPEVFYAQTRGFIDYIDARSGGATFFADAAQAVRHGATFSDWLGEHASEYGVPASVDALQEDWGSWLDEEFG